jgi:hypothetical protein
VVGSRRRTLAGSTTGEQALASAQKAVTRDMKRAGYIK